MKTFKIFILLLLCLVFVPGYNFVIDPVTNAVMHNEKGTRYLKDGYYALAVSEFKIAIALNPKSAASATFYDNLGTAYMSMHRYDWAISCYKSASNLNPNFLEYYINMVKAYKAKKTLNNEVNNYIKVLKKDRSNSRAWLILGLMYEELNYNYEAILCYKEFKKLEPELIISKYLDANISRLRNKGTEL